ncbi:MAG: LTA synthase family protein [Desulfitobacteriia bacterium]
MFNTAVLTLLPFIILTSYELIYRGSISETLQWLILNSNQFILTYALIFGLINLFYILPRRIYLAIGGVFLSLFSLAGYFCRQKLLLRGEPILPWDLKLGNEALYITKSIEGFSLALPILIVICCVVLIILSLKFIPQEKYLLYRKLTTAILSFALFFSLLEVVPIKKAFALQNITYSQKINYEKNGMLLGFMLNCLYPTVEEPLDYEKETVLKIAQGVKNSYPTNPDFKPNIIFLMSEAFWDPTTMQAIEFNIDPIPFFRSLEKDYTSGTLITPVFAGATANTEFEVLTGFSTHFLPAGIVPYVQTIDRPLEALPAIYKRQGYATSAIHTYHNWFYRRNLVYQNLGFDKFISKEFFVNPEYDGSYIKDKELSKKIIEQLRQTEEPDFIYAVSMQAHGPYSAEEQADNPFEVKGNLSPESKNTLENYCRKIADADKALELLVQELEELDEPTLLIFFGDHLPLLGNNSEVYKEAGFLLDDNSYEDYLRKYSVPFVIWDNFSGKKEHLCLSTSFLGSYVLEKSRTEGSLFTDFLTGLRKQGVNVIANTEAPVAEEITKEQLAHYQLLQYDFLSGNEYSYQLCPENKPSPNTSFLLGDNLLTIENINIPDKTTLEVQGTSFSPDTQIYINDKPMATSFVDSNLLTTDLPQGLAKDLESLKIQVKIIDSMKNIISESNTLSGSLISKNSLPKN